MKKLLLTSLIAMCVIHTYAQIVNLNPDPNGDPWIAGGVKSFTQAEINAINAIPKLQLSAASAATTLPVSVDNSTLQYFPDIGLQTGASCAQFAGIYYTFTYEINRLRNTSSNGTNKTYHSLYTYNFLNGGTNAGTSTTDGWDIVIENGCPTIETFGENANIWTWMNGYDNYYQAQKNRIDTYNQIYILDDDDLNTLKHWINDHNAGENTGGLSVFYCNSGGWNIDLLPPESSNSGDEIILEFGNTGAHAMTIVGYDDNIKYDFNGDGQFTNDLDINNDGEVDLLDWEIGGVKVANSWGTGFGDDGFIFVPYRLLANSHSNGIWNGKTFMMEAIEDYSPEITFKTTVDHSSRSHIQYRIGYGELASSQNPLTTEHFSSFNFQGGTYPMQGNNNNSLESSLDFSYMYPNQDFGKLFFQVVDNSSGPSSNGEIESFSVVDYRFGEVFELECPLTNVTIQPGATTQMGIEYHLFPFDVNTNTTIADNRVVRLDPVIRTNSTVTILAGTKLDFYNSDLVVEEGATLIIQDNVELNAKDGNCALYVYGDIQVGQNVEFNGKDPGNVFILYPNNQNTTVSNADFRYAAIKGGARYLTIDNCELNESYIDYRNGENLMVDATTFNNGYVYVSRTGSKCGDVSIENSTFNNLYMPYGPTVRIEGYPSFNIENNKIYFKEVAGVSLQYSGASCYQHNIDNNIIQSIPGNTITYGIELQRSNVLINNNSILDAKVGIRSGDNSYVSLAGNAGAGSEAETQVIKDNDVYQIYTSDDSFPYYFKYNAIYGNNSPYVYYNGIVGALLDVEDNYWGVGFNPSTDLYPSGGYDFQPEWTPGGLKGSETADEALELYENALSLTSNEKYTESNSILKDIVDQYPQTAIAKAALGALLSNEKLDAEEFMQLKTYFLQNETINAHADLLVTAEALSNWCDVYEGNYAEAIAFFENIILNSEDENHVIYAEIDLAYTYLLMEEEEKITGQLAGRVPTSYSDFQQRRTGFLQKLTYAEDAFEDDNVYSKDAVVDVYPNPAKEKLTFSVVLNKASDVEIVLYNMNGQVIDLVCQGKETPGVHTFSWNNNEKLDGVYLYSIKVDETLYHGKIILIN